VALFVSKDRRHLFVTPCLKLIFVSWPDPRERPFGRARPRPEEEEVAVEEGEGEQEDTQQENNFRGQFNKLNPCL
jgi:hypothetical protein